MGGKKEVKVSPSIYYSYLCYSSFKYFSLYFLSFPTFFLCLSAIHIIPPLIIPTSIIPTYIIPLQLSLYYASPLYLSLLSLRYLFPLYDHSLYCPPLILPLLSLPTLSFNLYCLPYNPELHYSYPSYPFLSIYPSLYYTTTIFYYFSSGISPFYDPFRQMCYYSSLSFSSLPYPSHCSITSHFIITPFIIFPIISPLLSRLCYCSLPGIHEIKCMYLASRTHGLFIT
jgi:hypothetical protein